LTDLWTSEKCVVIDPGQRNMAATTTPLHLRPDLVAALDRQRPPVRVFENMAEFKEVEVAMRGVGRKDHSASWLIAYVIGKVDFVTPPCIVDHVNRDQSMRLDADWTPVVEFSDAQWETAVSMTKACLQQHEGATDAACLQMTNNCRDARHAALNE
jgi:hypothetical protein